MKNTKEKLIALIIIVAYLSFGFSSAHFFDAKTAFAHENTIHQTHNMDMDCSQELISYDQEATNNCGECVNNFHCHFDCLEKSTLVLSFIETESLYISEDAETYRNINYPPESPPS